MTVSTPRIPYVAVLVLLSALAVAVPTSAPAAGPARAAAPYAHIVQWLVENGCPAAAAGGEESR